jgi:hypothetical protein
VDGFHVQVTSASVEKGTCTVSPEPATAPAGGAALKVKIGAGGVVSDGTSAHTGVVLVNVA